MRKERILQEFRKLSCICSFEALDKYVEFCLSHGNKPKIQGSTSSHHILPVSKTLPFKQYSNLREFTWNLAELTYYEHYYAHFLLTRAVNHLSIFTSFAGMHNKDVCMNRLNAADLIPNEEFNRIYVERNKFLSQYRSEIIETEFGKMSRASYYYRKNKHKKTYAVAAAETSKRMKENNIVNLPGIKEKMRDTKSQTFINGKNLDTLSAERAAKTMKKPFTDKDGQITTIYNQSSIKISTKVKTEFINDQGELTSIAKERTKKQKETLRSRGKWYVLKNVFNSEFSQTLSYADLRRLSPGLADKTKENYLGKSTFGSNALKKKNKENLIGLFVEILPTIQTLDTLAQDQNQDQ